VFRSFIGLLGILPELEFGGSVQVLSHDGSRRKVKVRGATNVDQEINGRKLKNQVPRKQLAVDKSSSIMSGEATG
jgi:hypothetical protein